MSGRARLLILGAIIIVGSILAFHGMRVRRLSGSDLQKWRSAPAAPAELKPEAEELEIQFVHQGCTNRRDGITETKLCEVIHNPQLYDGKCVRVTAELLADGMHGMVLIDGSCTQGFVPWWPDSYEAKEDIQQLYLAIWNGKAPYCTTKTARFTGRVHWASKPPHIGNPNRKRIFLDITSITNMKVRPTSDQKLMSVCGESR